MSRADSSQSVAGQPVALPSAIPRHQGVTPLPRAPCVPSWGASVPGAGWGEAPGVAPAAEWSVAILWVRATSSFQVFGTL